MMHHLTRKGLRAYLNRITPLPEPMNIGECPLAVYLRKMLPKGSDVSISFLQAFVSPPGVYDHTSYELPRWAVRFQANMQEMLQIEHPASFYIPTGEKLTRRQLIDCLERT